MDLYKNTRLYKNDAAFFHDFAENPYFKNKIIYAKIIFSVKNNNI